MKLTEHLVSKNKQLFERATHHQFLSQIGNLEIAPQYLKSWIIQDRYYTGGYIKMIGIMISRLPLYQDQRELGDNDPSYSPEKASRIIQLLSFALSNIYRESGFFTDILKRPPYAQIEQQSMAQKPWTTKYIDYLKKVAHESGYDLGEALIVLWAMEDCFYTAWKHAKSIHHTSNPAAANVVRGNEVHQETCKELMTNWTMEEFGIFVNDCAALVDELQYEKDPRRLASFEKVFKEILGLELEFWDMAYDYHQ